MFHSLVYFQAVPGKFGFQVIVFPKAALNHCSYPFRIRFLDSLGILEK